MTVFSDEEPTRGSLPRLVARSVPPLSSDPLEAVGQMMAETVRQGRRVDELGDKVQGFENMLIAALAKLERERPELVHVASTRAATHTSNRLAALLGALAILYTETAPILHELWRSIHR